MSKGPSYCLALMCVVALASTVYPQAPAPAATAIPPTPAAIEKGNSVLAECRQALGGEKLAALKTLTASGRTRRLRGNNLVPIEFETFIELPDKYLRADESPFENTDPTSSGFSGDALIQIPPPPSMPAGLAPPGARGGAPAGPPVDPRRARVTALKQDFARLSLGLFAASPALPLTFAYAAEAEAPQGKADVLDAQGEGTFALRLFIHRDTRLPIMVSWTTPPMRGQTAPVEQRLYFSDYRDVDGVKLPFRLRRAVGADTTEETTFDRFRVNGKIDPRKFEPVK